MRWERIFSFYPLVFSQFFVWESHSSLDLIGTKLNSKQTMNPYTLCVLPQNREELRRALKNGLKPDDLYDEENCIHALFYPVYSTSFDIEPMQLLLDYGANPNIRNESDETPLFFAPTVEAASLLIQHGADIHHRSSDGSSVLFFAQTPELIAFFLSCGVDKSLRNNDGLTAKEHHQRDQKLSVLL